MVKKIGSLLLLFFSVMAMAQNYSNHKVLKGETVTSIAQKYKVTPYDIYRLNPDVQNGIKENMVLLIPSLAVVKTTTNAVASHQVLPKETLYSIAKQYNTTIDVIEKANPTLKTEGLKIGQTITIPSKQALPEATIISHQVQPKETKYGIASKYGITVEELEKQNPEIKEGLPIGIVLKINKKADSNTTAIIEPTDTAVKPTETAVVPKIIMNIQFLQAKLFIV